MQPSQTIRLKPKNKIQCYGVLKINNRVVASISHLAIAYHPETKIVGGRFQIEWHRMKDGEPYPSHLDILVEYHQAGQISQSWTIQTIEILETGIPLVIKNLGELLGKEITFFAKNMEHI